MSTVSNPYTFNIKSNCGVSTNTLLSNNQAKITMVYSSNEESETIEDPDFPENPELWPTYNYTIDILEYDFDKNVGNLFPDIINENGIRRVRCTDQYGDIESSSCLLFIKTFGKKYSKVILNGGPFKNCIIPYNGDTVNGFCRFYVESSESISGLNYAKWEQYNKVPFDFTIKFVK